MTMHACTVAHHGGYYIVTCEVCGRVAEYIDDQSATIRARAHEENRRNAMSYDRDTIEARERAWLDSIADHQAICVICGHPLEPDDGPNLACSACLRDAFGDPT